MYGYRFEECDFEVTYQEAVEEVERHKADIEAFRSWWEENTTNGINGMIDADKVLSWLGY